MISKQPVRPCVIAQEYDAKLARYIGCNINDKSIEI